MSSALENVAQLEQVLQSITKRMQQAKARVGRSADEVALLAVTKTLPVSQVQAAILCGQLYFGENYVQEARAKIAELEAAGSSTSLRFDLIGSLQSNKVKQAVGVFDIIQTVDRISLAEMVSQVAESKNLRQKIFVQVNISEEATKSGMLPAQVADFCKNIAKLPGLDIQGLMSIGRYYRSDEPEVLRRGEFREMVKLKREVEHGLGVPLAHLCMGMSHDFELAIEEGATIVRIGTALFGARKH